MLLFLLASKRGGHDESERTPPSALRGGAIWSFLMRSAVFDAATPKDAGLHTYTWLIHPRNSRYPGRKTCRCDLDGWGENKALSVHESQMLQTFWHNVYTALFATVFPKLTTREVRIGKHIRAFSFRADGERRNVKVICHAPHLLIVCLFSHAGASERACERPELRAEANEKEIERQIL